MYKIIFSIFVIISLQTSLLSQTNRVHDIKVLDRKLKDAIDHQEHNAILQYVKELKNYLENDYGGEILFYEAVALYNTGQFTASKKVMKEYIHSSNPSAANFSIAVELYKSIKTKHNELVKDLQSKENKFYIQVHSFFEQIPGQNFFDTITSHGYSYIFHQQTTKKSNLTKVLIGPFKDLESAKKKLKDVRLKIEPKAYIFEMK